METLVVVGLGLLAAEALLSLWSGLSLFASCRPSLPAAVPTGARQPGAGEAGGGRAGAGEEPRVLLVVPCKGLEPDLEKNLRSLLRQDWNRLRVRFVTATVDDPAAPVIRALLEEAPARADWHVAGRLPGRAEKAENLRSAVRAGLDAEVLVTADSDGHVDPGWLGRLLAGLPEAEGPPGAATGYRWYVPAGGAGAWLQSAWNAATLSALAAGKPPFVWGGATAIRRCHLEATDVLDRWERTASDDLALTRALRQVGGTLVFVPEALVVSRARDGVVGTLGWIRRQMLLARVYAPGLWRTVVGFQVGWTAFVTAGLALAPARPLVAALVAFVLGASMVKGGLRHAAVRGWLAGRLEMSSAATVAYALLAPTFGPVTAACGLASLGSRRLRWRGVTYELVGPEHTDVVARGEVGGQEHP